MDAEPIRIAFGTTVLAQGLSSSGIDGIGSYTKELLNNSNKQGDIDFLPFTFGKYKKNIFSQEIDTIELRKYSKSLIKDFFYSGTEKELKRKNIQLVHATDHMMPYCRNLPVVSTIMDAIPLSNPEWVSFPPLAKAKFNLWKKIACRSNHIITISEYSRQEIISHFNIPSKQVSVTPLGVGERFFEEISTLEKKKVLNSLRLREGFFINIGTLQPRKNVETILDAMLKLPLKHRRNAPLVIVGRSGWSDEVLKERLRKAEQEGWCRWLSHISDYKLRALLQSSQALVFPSLAEGFGLPVVEAFASCTPVITSNTTSLPEIAGDAALLIDPLDSDMLSETMQDILENDELRQSLILKGRARALSFNWESCAEKTLDIYRKVLNVTS